MLTQRLLLLLMLMLLQLKSEAFNFPNLLLSQILQWRTFSLRCIFYQQMYLPIQKKTKISPCDITNNVFIRNISEYDHTCIPKLFLTG